MNIRLLARNRPSLLCSWIEVIRDTRKERFTRSIYLRPSKKRPVEKSPLSIVDYLPRGGTSLTRGGYKVRVRSLLREPSILSRGL